MRFASELTKRNYITMTAEARPATVKIPDMQSTPSKQSKPSTGKSLEDPESTKNSRNGKLKTPSTPSTSTSKSSFTSTAPRPRSNTTFKSSSPGTRNRVKSNSFTSGSRPKSGADEDTGEEILLGAEPISTTTPYSLELIEGPQYIKRTVIPPVLQAINDLMFLIKFGTVVPDPIQFIALKLKPSLTKPAVRYPRMAAYDSKLPTLRAEENLVLGEALLGSMQDVHVE